MKLLTKTLLFTKFQSKYKFKYRVKFMTANSHTDFLGIHESYCTSEPLGQYGFSSSDIFPRLTDQNTFSRSRLANRQEIAILLATEFPPVAEFEPRPA